MYNINHANAQHAQVTYSSKKVKEKLLNTNAAIWFHTLLYKNQQDALFYSQFSSVINLYMYRASLLFIIRRYFCVYSALCWPAASKYIKMYGSQNIKNIKLVQHLIHQVETKAADVEKLVSSIKMAKRWSRNDSEK